LQRAAGEKAAATEPLLPTVNTTAWCFLYVFGKNERDNITEQERVALAQIGDEYMRLTPDKLNELIVTGALTEVVCDEDEQEVQPDSR